MGFKASEWAFSLPLAPAMKATLAALAHRADDKSHECFPGQATIARMTGQSRSTVNRALADMESLGVITRTRRNTADGYRTSDLFRLNRDTYVSESQLGTEPTRQSTYLAERTGLGVTVRTPMSHSDIAIGQSVNQSVDQSVKEHVHQDDARPSIDDDFAEWWLLYPRKQGKAEALKAYTVARKKHDARTLRDGAQAYALLNIGVEKHFLKLPAGWIRGERWADEEIATPASTNVTPLKDWQFTAHKARQPVAPKECKLHPGYPVGNWMNPCARCAREKPEEARF